MKKKIKNIKSANVNIIGSNDLEEISEILEMIQGIVGEDTDFEFSSSESEVESDEIKINIVIKRGDN